MVFALSPLSTVNQKIAQRPFTALLSTMRLAGFLLAVCGNFRFAAAFVLPTTTVSSPTSPCKTILVQPKALQALPLSLSPNAFLAASLSSSTLNPASSVQSWIDTDVVMTVAVVASFVLTVILIFFAKDVSYGMHEQPSNDENTNIQERNSSGKPCRSYTGQSLSGPPPEESGTMGRRGTLTTLVGGAVSFAASDVLLGRLLDVGSGMASTVYGARWNGLYSRIAQATTTYGQEAAVVSPELLAFISKSSAALTNPELRAWIAAQRAFNKSRALAAVAGAAIADEGIVAAAVTRTAAATATAIAASVASDSTTVDDGTADSTTAASLKANTTVTPTNDGNAEIPLSLASTHVSSNDDEHQIGMDSKSGELPDNQDEEDTRR